VATAALLLADAACAQVRPQLAAAEAAAESAAAAEEASLARIAAARGAGGAVDERLLSAADAAVLAAHARDARIEEAAGDFFKKAPTLILFTDALTDAAAGAAALAAFREVAAEHFDAAAGGPKGALRFAVCAEGDGAADGVRRFLALKDKDGPTACRVELVDVKRQRRAALGAGAADALPTAAQLRKIVASFDDGSAVWGELK
jgi:hypothetical protein